MIAAALLAAAAIPDRRGLAVVDAAHVLPVEAARTLNNRIVAWDRATKHDLVVTTVPALGDEDIQELGVRMGRTWKLGRPGVGDGVILLLAPNQRKLGISVGTGLEPSITDALTHEIEDSMKAKLKAGDTAGALSDGADQIMAAAKLEGHRAAVAEQDDKPSFPWGILWVLGALGGLVGGWLGWTARVERKRREEARAQQAAADKAWRERMSRPSVLDTHTRAVTPTPPRVPPRRVSSTTDRRSSTTIIPIVAPVPSYSPPSPPTPSYDYGSSSSSSSSSSDSSSSWSSFDSGGGGDFSGGGSSSDY